MRRAGLRPVATVRLDGTDVTMLVDSGAFFSMLTRSAATQLGLELHHLPYGMRTRARDDGRPARDGPARAGAT